MTARGSDRGRLRALEISAVVCLAALILWVYVAKAAGADERAAIRDLESEIVQTRREIRLLHAEAAHLEQPARLEALVQAHLELQPATAGQATGAGALAEVLPVAGPAEEVAP